MRTSAHTAIYSPTAKGLHWLIVLLLTAQFTTAFVLPHLGRNAQLSDVVSLHFSLGVAIMLVMLIRLVHRLILPVPLEAGDAAPWERLLAKTTHYLFYLILIVAPPLGWASASAHRLPVSLFGLVDLPPLAAAGAQWANRAGDLHATAMWALLWLIGLHVAGALFHHLVRRDGSLMRMAPMPSGEAPASPRQP